MSNGIQNINEIAPMKDGGDGVKDEVQADYLLGKSQLENGNTAQAAVSLHNALVGYEERGDENGIANASNQLGNVCLARDEYDTALEHYARAEEICRRLGDPMSVLAVSRRVVEVHRKQGKVADAITRCLDMLDFFHANNNPKGTVELLEEMADIYIEAGERAKAADAYRTISSIHKNFKHENIAAEYLKKASAVEQGS